MKAIARGIACVAPVPTCTHRRALVLVSHGLASVLRVVVPHLHPPGGSIVSNAKASIGTSRPSTLGPHAASSSSRSASAEARAPLSSSALAIAAFDCCPLGEAPWAARAADRWARLGATRPLPTALARLPAGRATGPRTGRRSGGGVAAARSHGQFGRSSGVGTPTGAPPDGNIGSLWLRRGCRHLWPSLNALQALRVRPVSEGGGLSWLGSKPAMATREGPGRDLRLREWRG